MSRRDIPFTPPQFLASFKALANFSYTSATRAAITRCQSRSPPSFVLGQRCYFGNCCSVFRTFGYPGTGLHLCFCFTFILLLRYSLVDLWSAVSD